MRKDFFLILKKEIKVLFIAVVAEFGLASCLSNIKKKSHIREHT